MTSLTNQNSIASENVVLVDTVVDWVAKQGEKGDMGGAAARLRCTGIRQLAELVAEDEPRGDAKWVHDNAALPRIAGRGSIPTSTARRPRRTRRALARRSPNTSVGPPRRPPIVRGRAPRGKRRRRRLPRASRTVMPSERRFPGTGSVGFWRNHSAFRLTTYAIIPPSGIFCAGTAARAARFGTVMQRTTLSVSIACWTVTSVGASAGTCRGSRASL
jgi:hypothetical protein